ncbi:MAG: pyridoxal-phosphate dependent enzyme [Nitrospiraceae bacterium]|jgi:threonine dehydratase
METLSFGEICEAAATLKGIAHVTPVMTSDQLNETSGARVFLKCENFQRVGAFKFRGAYYAISRIAVEAPHKPVVTLSSGNHAQGVALACRLYGLEAHVVMPSPVNRLKRQATMDYGAIVHEASDRRHAEQIAASLCENLHGVLVHPFNDLAVMAGQGTTMLELFDQVPNMDAILAPVSGGGLLSGVCVAAHALDESLKIYACEPAGALDAMYSVQENRIVPMTDPHTIADGLRASLGTRTLPILREHVAGFFVAEEHEIIEAMRFAHERLKLVIEPSSAVALAPLLRREPFLLGKRVGVIITGGNVDLSALWQSLEGATNDDIGRSVRKK